MDSNRKILDTNLLWKNSTMVECPTIPTLLEKINSTPLNNYDIVVVHVGVNDIDSKDGQTVADELCNAAEAIHNKAPNIKIVLSEVTPRQHTRDDEVIECNKLLKSSISDMKQITLAKHTNLRSPEMFRNSTDDKHFSTHKAGLLASNIKRALRKALGIHNDWRHPNGHVKSNQKRRAPPKKGNKNALDLKDKLMNFLQNL